MKKSICLLFMLFAIKSGFAQAQQPIKLYPKGVPNSKTAPATYVEKTVNNRMSMVTEPTITPYLPEKGKANGAAIIVCPGGGYAILSMKNEGSDIGTKFAEAGVTAFVLKYRLPSDSVMVNRNIGPLQDAQRAIQMVREKAADWGIDPNRVGIIGFSAGGHLASTAITHFDKPVIENKKGTNLRPDFGVLMYPVITMTELTHKGSKKNLIGEDAPADKVDLYSNEKQVTANTPPAFLVHAEDDKTVPVLNSVMFYEAMVKAGVKGELHIYQAGGHGFGLNNKTTQDQWFDRCINWMQANGWLTAK